MSEPSTGDPASVAVALAELRGTMETGFATVNGSVQLLAQRTDQTDRRLNDHEKRLDSVERGRWPLPTIGVLAAVAAVVIPLMQR